VMFNGDKEQILADTARKLGGVSLRGRKDAGHVDPGTPLGEDQFQMMVGCATTIGSIRAAARRYVCARGQVIAA